MSVTGSGNHGNRGSNRSILFSGQTFRLSLNARLTLVITSKSEYCYIVVNVHVQSGAKSRPKSFFGTHSVTDILSNKFAVK